MPEGGDQFQARTAAQVLADRLAMAVVRHEPGWRLPRRSVLARRYNVGTAQIDAAISELFRIVVQTEEVPLRGGEGSLSRAWTHTAQGRES
jgi:hypothetical protein